MILVVYLLKKYFFMNSLIIYNIDKKIFYIYSILKNINF